MRDDAESSLNDRLWAVVLAAGEGRRLLPLTRALHGRDVPKQFAEIEPGASMLQTTLERIAPLVPERRTIVVVDRSQERVARRQLERFSGTDLLLQPVNRDTGPGILLPLARILARDPAASVAVFPSDHHVPRPAPFLLAVRRAVAEASSRARSVVLLGIVPDGAEGEYGWIVPGPAPVRTGRGLGRVLRFVEKPDRDTAERLLATGALWNAFVMAGRAGALWALARTGMPAAAHLFAALVPEIDGPREAEAVAALYERVRPANFSRAVLERARGLLVAPVAGSGWSDWGSPARVFRSLEGEGSLETLFGRIRPGVALAGAGPPPSRALVRAREFYPPVPVSSST